jgi:hypothetical protein
MQMASPWIRAKGTPHNTEGSWRIAFSFAIPSSSFYGGHNTAS